MLLESSRILRCPFCFHSKDDLTKPLRRPLNLVYTVNLFEKCLRFCLGFSIMLLARLDVTMCRTQRTFAVGKKKEIECSMAQGRDYTTVKPEKAESEEVTEGKTAERLGQPMCNWESRKSLGGEPIGGDSNLGAGYGKPATVVYL
jgi:hypothetical protein